VDDKADAATHFTRTETHTLFQSEADAVIALGLKRDISDSYSLSETSALLAAKVDETTFKAQPRRSRIRKEA